jgi:ligand-binding sensor domain-containing protein/signal transduction histidine kinase
MFSHFSIPRLPTSLCHGLVGDGWKHISKNLRRWLVLLAFSFSSAANAVVLWSDLDATTVRNNGDGTDLLGGAVKRDGLANDTLYFKFHVDPLSDATTEPYFAALELYDGDTEHLGIGNALSAWAYSAFLNSSVQRDWDHLDRYIDLRSAKPNLDTKNKPVNFQLPKRGSGVTIVFKIQFVPGSDDLVTVWLNPDLGPGATEVGQSELLTTRFNANATFDELRLRHSGNGDGWTFSDLAIATSFGDFVDVSGTKPGEEEVDFTHGVQSLHFHSWSKEQGLPEIPVRVMAQTRDGYLWIGGDAGVTRFDGLRFVTFDGQMGLTNHPVRTLFGDSHGALWIGSATGGLERWEDGQEIILTTNSGLPTNSVTALAEDNQGRIWIGTEAGLVIWQNGQLVFLNNAEEIKSHAITTLFKDRQGKMWLGVRGAGVFERIGEKFLPITDPTEQMLLEDPHCLLVDQIGRLWVGTGSDAVLCRENNRWHRYRVPQHQASPFVTALAEEPDGTVWAGSTGGGLYQFSEGKFTSVPASAGLTGSAVGALLLDREGKLWVGTDEGLNRLQRKSLFTLGQSEGLGFGAVQGLAEVSPGVVWAVKPSDGIYRWDGRSFNRLNAAGLSLHESQINTLLLAQDGVCWVAGENGLLRYKDPVAAADEAKLFALPGESILALSEDHDGSLWAGTKKGNIWWLRDGKWFAQNNLTLSNAITAILPVADGSVWIGTDGAGLFRSTGRTLEQLGKPEGLTSAAIRALYRDAQGTLWIGTVGGGLSRWRENNVKTFTTREGLPDNNIFQILEDDSGRLWLGTGRGIACVSKSQLEKLTVSKSQIYPKVFDLAQECTGGFCPTGLKTKSGLLWFPTTKGAVVVAPNTLTIETPMPGVKLEEILVDGVPDASNHASGGVSPLRIAPGKHRVEFRYTGLCFDAPEAIRFRYKLEGWDADWVDAGTSRTAIYNFVPPGKYRFRVIACNSDGIWPAGGAELSLVFQQYFWQSWWFIGSAGVGILIGVGVAVRMVTKRKMKNRLNRLEQEHALEQERTRIAQDLHDEMGAKLCRISFLSEHARREDITPTDLQEQITSISDDSREVLHSLDEIVWAVNPQNDTLEHVASYLGQYAQDYFQVTGIECEVDNATLLPPYPVPSQMRHHLFLAVREALTNVLKHSGATKVKVSLAGNDSQFQITIEDNGKGFDLSAAQVNIDSSASESGNGLVNMARRLSKMGGNSKFESKQGSGTTVKFILPLKPLVKL